MRLRGGAVLLVFGLTVLGTACSWSAVLAQPEVNPESASPPANLPQLRARIAEILARYGVAGAGIAVATRDGTVWADGVGLSDIATGSPATAQTVFRMGSITKNVVALTTMQLVEEGRLSLDSRLRDLAPDIEFENAWEATQPVTVASLLEHTAGFELGRFNEDFEPHPRPLLDALRLNPRSRVSRWRPGTRMSYSNEGYDATGYILEQLTNRSFDEVIDERVFAPLAMRTAAMQLTSVTATNLSRGYDANGRAVPYLEDLQRPAANLLASASDMARYLEFWVRGGELDGRRLVSPESLERMRHRRTLAYPGPAEEYGLGTDTAQFGRFIAHGHSGYTNGFVASFRYFPDEHVGWVFMLNHDTANEARAAIEDELVRFLLPGSTTSMAVSPVGTAAPDLAPWAGFYRDVTPSTEIETSLTTVFSGTQVELRNGSLWERTSGLNGLRSLVSLGRWRLLTPTGPDAFRHDGETISSVAFARSDTGPTVLITQNGFLMRDTFALVLLQRGLLLVGLASVLSTLVVVPLRLALEPVGFGQSLGSLPLWIPQAVAGLALVGAWLALTRTTELLGQMNATTVSLFVLSLLFAVMSVLSVACAVWLAGSNATLLAKAYVLLVAIAAAGLTLFAWQAHWIGLRTWLW